MSAVALDPVRHQPRVNARMARGIQGAAIAVMLVFAIAICLHYGRLGILPLDNAIVFDGGWRILSGQRPFVDFTTPVAITPIVMQAALFRVLGVSWFTYCLHAALLNALFALLTLAVMRAAPNSGRSIGGLFCASAKTT